ncbi:polymorphic toxin-type HINT domain-containing protein [Streptomyces sp. NBC_00162]|uniref:polymorphic toxin-type HINT domain-containing protein n=1 Tax=Streptomyces sp. NBC_00162 TaxID=2903629 RepID=UPI00214BAABF|nr:polymorphic toxin-type HINT domain-containing protein [Streptomyces sp. NBC_00162]UUU44375.1 polymorphic toxin-type HINT domain-containing protein [Streptomyces sp. NBC_00162]
MSIRSGMMPELFGGGRFRRKRRLRAGIVGATAVALSVSLLTGPAWAGPAEYKPRGTQKTPSVTGKNLKPQGKKAPAAAPSWKPSKVTWPSASSAEVTLSAAAPLADAAPYRGAQAKLPVRVTKSAKASLFLRSDAANDSSSPERVKITVADRKTAQKAGIDGLLLSVQRKDSRISGGRVQVEVDYSKIKDAYGANWASSLHLVRLPACALTTPSKPECLKTSSVPTHNHQNAATLTADVDLAETAPTQDAKPAAVASAAGGMTVLAAVASADGSEGSFKATSLAASGSWSAGGNSGGFGWNVPITVPPVPGGFAPKVGFSYSSSSVDGRTGSTNNQSSWVGEGWEYSPGFIERKYAPCENDKQGGSNTEDVGDLCWKSENATMSLNGSSTELLWDAGKGLWKLANDDGSRVERIYDSPGNNSGDEDSEYWRITTTDGTQYWFGKNRLPGWSAGKEETSSVNAVPVFGNHAGEPGRGADFASSSRMQGWRWNLDYVVDPHGNAMAMYYTKYTGYYAKNMKMDTPVAYTRDSTLRRISYGLRDGQVYATPKPAGQVNFWVSDRCMATTCILDEAHANDWTDVPVHLDCKAAQQCLQGSPTFWSSKRLTSIDAYALVGTAHVGVDNWTLTQSYPPSGDTTKPALWLDSVQRTAKAGTLTDIPGVDKTVFAGQPMANRVDKADGRPPINKRRITQITNATGGTTLVTYTDQECSPSNLPAADDTNTKRCYPSWWTRDGGAEEVKDYFHKYLVASIEESDTTAGTGSPSKTTTYVYPGSPNWRRDQSEFTLDKHRTWSDFRGYRTVRTLTGTTNRTKAETDYYTGMAGDTLANDTPRTVATINGVADRRDFTGTVSESRTYSSETGAAVEKITQTPWVSKDNATQSVVGITDPDEPGTEAATLEPKTARFSGTSTTVGSKLLADGTWQKTTANRIYDEVYGLILTEGDDGANVTEAKCKVTQYVTPDTANWLIAYPRQVTTTTAKPCTETVSASSVTSAGRISYDGQAVGTAPKASQANITKAEQASKLDASSQLVWETAEQATHDQYGRVLTARGQDLQTTTTVYTPAADAQPTSVAITNAKGHTTTSAYDGLRGLALKLTDPNNRTVTSEYDALGRLIKGWAVGRSTSDQPNVTFTYNLSATAPSTVTTKKLYENGTWGTSVTLYDSQLRERQTQTDATGIAGRLISDAFYDDHGRVRWTNAPYYNNQPTSTTMLVVPDNQIPSATENRYDGRGRVTDSILLSLNSEKWRTTTTYGPDWQAVIPPQGAPATLTVADARGRAVERREYKDRNPVIGAAASQYQKHTYEYDRVGKLGKLTDTSGRNSWTYTYDLRGRQTEVTDPDKGKSTTVYGTDGRVQTISDARSVTLATTYDELGRKTSLRKSSVTGTKLAEWTYDTAPGGKALPASSTRYDGSAAYKSEVSGYDTLGQSTGIKLTVPSVTGEEQLAGTYTVAGTVTATNRLSATIAYSTTNTNATTALPAETVTHHYGAQDQLGIVDSSLTQAYLRGASYTPFGELAQAQFGNLGTMVTQTLTYDSATRRALSSVTDREASGPSELSNIKYTYNPAGNVTRILDDQSDRTVKDDQCFAYDWASRLTEAWTSGDNCVTQPVNGSGAPVLGSVDPYWTSWTFTDTGQRATEKQHKAGPIAADTTRTYTYPSTTGAAQAHAVRSVSASGGATGTDTYGYDATGNMTAKTAATGTAQTMAWNDEGKIASSTTAGATTSFLYDAQGTRILKREPAATTLYLPGGQELVLDKATKAVSGTRYYSVPGGTAMRTSTDGRVRFLIADHHGTNTLSIAASTLTYNRRKQLPYGAERGTPPAAWPSQKGFVGGDIDKTTNLTHIGARDYDTKLGQFISVDPLLDPGNLQSLNGYAYSSNNPVTLSDPDGMQERDCYYGMCGGHYDPRDDKAPDEERPPSIHDGHDGGTGSSPTWLPPPSITTPQGETIVLPSVNTEEFIDIYRTSYLHQVENWGADLNPEKDWSIRIAALLEACQKLSDRGCDPTSFLGPYLAVAAEEAGMYEGGGIQPPPAYGPGAFKGGKPGDCNKCFLAGTDVLMADGTTKNIEDIELGDEVWATNPETGESGKREVTRLIVTEDDKHFNTLSIATDDGIEELTATHEHPFWSPSASAWVEARELTPGSTLLTNQGKTVIVTANRPYTQHARTYNLTIDDLHTYYVLAGATPVLVHNSNGLCGTAALENGDWQHIADRHRPGGAKVDNTSGILTGKAKHVRGRIAETINRGKPRPNTPDPETGRPRPGQIYEWDFGVPVGRAGPANGGGELKSIRVVVNDGKVVTAFPF